LTEIKDLSFYLDGKKVTAKGPSSVQPGQTATFSLEFNQTASPENLKISSKAGSTINLNVKNALYYSKCSSDAECKTPPGNYCSGQYLRRAYSPKGTCSSGLCNYNYSDAACSAEENCEQGVCINERMPFCGNTVKEQGEACDLTDLAKATCASVLGTDYVGTLSCSPNCKSFITASCLTKTEAAKLTPKCGNKKLEAEEKCDMTDLGGQTCSSILGYGYVGTLGCSWDCKSFITAGCTSLSSTLPGFPGSSGPNPDAHCNSRTNGLEPSGRKLHQPFSIHSRVNRRNNC